MTGGVKVNAYSRREQRGWYFYDWANSAFMTTVVTLFFGPYLTSLAKAAAGEDGYVAFAGLRITPQAVWPYLVSASVLTQVLALPLVGAIADYARRKKEMLGLLAFAGAGATLCMYLLEGDAYLFGAALFLVANFAFGASVVIYNSFLPEIAGPDERDAVSSNGWGLGYAGGALLLVLNLVLYARADDFGITEGQAVRLSLASAGAWWGVFTLIPLATLRNRGGKRLPAGDNYVTAGVRQLVHTLRRARAFPQTLLFLVAYLVYNDGIQTVINLAAQFGQEEVGLPLSALTTAILISQIVAFFGAIAFKYVAFAIGNKRAVMVSLVIWSGTLFYVYAGVHSAGEFYLLAAIIGTVLGGSQALSRSIFSFLIPKGQEAEYFSLYEISDKGTSWLGPLFFGLALDFTGRYRTAVLSLIVFFLVGMALLAFVDVRRAAAEAGNAPPAA
ncbi:MAG: MFS transporter [Bryobacteraceae bacterium]|nr:MFS transporter [Bryobacteraceae bacterium]